MPEEAFQNEEVRKSGFFKELIKFSLIAFLIVVPFRYFVAQPFIVNGASMDPTFHTGEYLIVDQLSYRAFDNPQRGEIVIFRYPKDPSKFFIKRIVGLPGETIEMRENIITIFNDEYPSGFSIKENYIIHTKNDILKVELEEDEFFVLGDNRASSSDSRIWGPLKQEFIVGRPIIRLFPLNRIQLFPGDYSEAHI